MPRSGRTSEGFRASSPPASKILSMLEVREAQDRLLDSISTLSPVTVPLEDALGLTLAEPVLADRDFPPTDRSAMDGFAVRAVDCAAPGATLEIAGEIRAGHK